MAGPGAVIRIDGFEGGALPPKAMIRSIRIARDQFAAEFHSAGGVSIEIITQPGIGPMQYFSNALLRGSSLSGKSPFVPVRGPEQNVESTASFGLGGTIVVEQELTFFLNVFGIDAYDTPNTEHAGSAGWHRVARAESDGAAQQSLREQRVLDYAPSRSILNCSASATTGLTHVTNGIPRRRRLQQSRPVHMRPTPR